MTPQELNRYHATALAGRTQYLTPMQRLQIAECAFDHGFIETANVLELDPAELSTCMVESGYLQCPGCEEWREGAELKHVEDVNGDVVGSPVCEDCRG